MESEEKIKLIENEMQRMNRSISLLLYHNETYGELDTFKSIGFSLKQVLRGVKFANKIKNATKRKG